MMSNSRHATAVIPARGGSKRIPRKNIRPFLGIPLLQRTVQLALDSCAFDRVIVSTDDREIAEIAVDAGAETPFIRPRSLSDDYRGSRVVVQHAIEELEKSGARLDLVCSVYATAVFLRQQDLAAAREELVSSDAAFVFSGATFPFPIQRAVRRLDDGSVEMLDPQHRHSRSQDLEEAYHDAGQFYWGTRDAWMSDTHMFGRSSRLFVLPRWRVQDIDTLEDWRRAEVIARVLSLSDEE
jgi:N-acylneuraminate cytidylyltransferase